MRRRVGLDARSGRERAASYNPRMAKWLRALLLLCPLAAAALVLLVGIVGALLPGRYAVTASARYRQAPPAVWAVVSNLLNESRTDLCSV